MEELDLELVEIDVEVSSLFETFAIYATLISLAIGLFHLFFAKTALRLYGLEAMDGRAGARGETRSSFAGIIIGLSAVVFLFQQSTLFQTLGLAWAISAAVLLFSFCFAPKSLNLFKAFCCAFGLAYAGLILKNWGMPLQALWLESGSLQTGNIFIVIVIVFLIASGIVALLAPKMALKSLGLGSHYSNPFAVSGQFALVSGFYLALGIYSYLHFAHLESSQIFLTLAIFVSFLMTLIGRVILITVDKGYNKINFYYLCIEFILCALLGYFMLKPFGF